MQKNISNILKIAEWVLIGISVALFVWFFVSVVPMEEADQIESSTTSTFLNWAYILAAVCAVIALIFPIKNFIVKAIDNPKSVIVPVIVLAVVAVLFLIAYSLSSGDAASMAPTMVETTEGEIFWSGVGLNLLYIALGATVCAVIFAFVYPAIKK